MCTSMWQGTDCQVTVIAPVVPCETCDICSQSLAQNYETATPSGSQTGLFLFLVTGLAGNGAGPFKFAIFFLQCRTQFE